MIGRLTLLSREVLPRVHDQRKALCKVKIPPDPALTAVSQDRDQMRGSPELDLQGHQEPCGTFRERAFARRDRSAG